MGKERSFDLDVLSVEWGSSIVARTEIGRFSGGVLTSKSVANLDSLGKGPPGRFRLGRKVVYPVGELVGWMKGRMGPCTHRGPFEKGSET